MGIINKVFKPKSQVKKSYSSADFMSWPVGSTFEAMVAGGEQQSQLFFRYYHSVSAIATAIDTITDALVDVPLKIRNRDDNSFDEDAKPILLFRKPNCLQTYRDFIKELATNFLVAGNTFIKLTGDIESPPKEIFNVSPTQVHGKIGNDGIVSEYIVNRNGLTESYNRLESVSSVNCLRFVNRDKTAELVHIKDFNTSYNQQSIHFGVSKMSAILVEVEQLLKANVFNYSTLVRSSNVSMAVISKTVVNKAEEEAMKASIKNQWSGAERAGHVAFMMGDDLEIKEMSKTARDMEFQKLKEELTKIIYNRYNIPLALVNDKVMTFNNLATSSFMLYDNAVIPLARTLFDSFTLHVLPRYETSRATKKAPLSETHKFDINLRDITALETRQNERVKILSDVGVLTQNELRAELGFPEIEGGAVLPLNAIKAVKYFDRQDKASFNPELPNMYDH